MITGKEYRVNLKGSLLGHYVIASTPAEAKAMLSHKYPNEKIEVHLWKTQVKGHFYPSKLSPYARRKLRSMA